MPTRVSLWCAALFGVAALAGCTATVDGGGGGGNSSTAGPPGSTGGTSNTGNNGGGAAGSATNGGPMVARNIDLTGEPKYYRVVRLTNQQWAASVKEVLKLAQPSGLESSFQKPVEGATDFSNNELSLEINQRAWGDYQAAADKLADQVTSSAATLANVYSGTDAAGFIKAVGRRAYRRPLTDAEVAAYTKLYDTGSASPGTKGAFAAGVTLVLRAMLQSPHFLYRTELGASGAPLSGYEVAAKLSLWLRGGTPNDELLDAASTLTSSDAVAAEVQSMLEEPTTVATLRDFHRQLLHFDRFETIAKLNVPSYSEALNAEYQESSYLFFDRIFNQNLGVRDILTSTRGFVGPGLAKLYGVAATGSGFTEQDLGARRVGYFSQLAYLTLNAINNEQDSIHRGVSLNLDMLCAPLGPPASVIPPVPELKPGQTNRQRISTLTQGCGMACHNEMINPLGFAFEHFDGMGQYHDTENGNLEIDSSGTYTFTEGAKSYDDNVGLMNAMAESEQAHLCYAKKLASYSLQRDIVIGDLPWLSKLAEASRASGGSVKRIMLELAKSDAFRAQGAIK